MRVNERYLLLILAQALSFLAVPAQAQWIGGIGVHNYWVGSRVADRENSSPYIGLYGTAGRIFPVGDRNALFLGAEFGFGDSSGLRHGPGDLAHLEGQLSEGYLVVPILAGRSFPITDQLSLVPYAGPSVSLGLWSKMSIDRNRDDWLREYGEEVNMYSALSGYSRWFYGVRTGIAFLLPKESGYMHVGADFGLKNRYRGRIPDGTITTNRVFLSFNLLF